MFNIIYACSFKLIEKKHLRKVFQSQLFYTIDFDKIWETFKFSRWKPLNELKKNIN